MKTELATTSRLETEQIAFDLKSLAQLIACSVGLLRLEIQRGRLRPTRVGDRRIVITASEVARYLRAREGLAGR